MKTDSMETFDWILSLNNLFNIHLCHYIYQFIFLLIYLFIYNFGSTSFLSKFTFHVCVIFVSSTPKVLPEQFLGDSSLCFLQYDHLTWLMRLKIDN